MATSKALSEIDAEFYRPAEAFFAANKHIALTYDDVTLATLYSEVLPGIPSST